jgi:ankyrin repeat protein
MNYSKLFLMMALGVSLNNGACGMEQENKKRKREDESPNEQQKKLKTDDKPKYSAHLSEELIETVKNNGGIESIKPLLTLDDDGFCADVNSQQNKYGATPLHFAAYNGNKECIQLLLDQGAHVNAQESNNLTPLHITADKGQKECIQLLVENGAHVNVQNNYGETPLHWVAYKGNKECVESIINFIKDAAKGLNYDVQRLAYLCSIDKIFRGKCEICLIINRKQHGALKIPKYLCREILLQSWDPTHFITELVNTKSNNDKTALDLAREKNYEEIVELLEPYENKKHFCILN